jgi:translation elongation factor EF-4
MVSVLSSFIMSHGADMTSVVRKSGTQVVSNPTDFPEPDEPSHAYRIEEPMIKATIIVPEGG